MVGGIEQVGGVSAPELRELEHLKTTAAFDEDARNAHVRTNVALVAKRLQDAPAHDRPAVLVCYGPSLRRLWPVAAMQKQAGADVFSVSGSHGFLLDKGIVPTAHIDCDPRLHKSEQFGEPHAQVQYWLASCVHPEYVKRLSGYDVSLWHLWNGEASNAVMDDIEPGAWMVMGGGSVGLFAITLLYCLGYRRLLIVGMDCSYSEDGAYAGPHLGKPRDVMRVQCGDRWFSTNALLISYARQFGGVLGMVPDMRVSLCGDGLLSHMQKISQESSCSP